MSMDKFIDRKKIKNIILYSLIILGIFLGILILILLIHDYYPQIKQLFNPRMDRIYLKKDFRNHGLKDAIYLTLLTSILTAIPGAPISVICIFNGVLYGPLYGILINIIGEVIGNLLVVYLLYHFHFIKTNRRNSKQLLFFKKFKNPMVAITLGYAISFIPSSFTSYVAIKMNMKFRKLLTCIFLGILPTSILYAFGGDAVFKGNKLKIIIILILIFVILIVFLFIYHVFTRRLEEKWDI